MKIRTTLKAGDQLVWGDWSVLTLRRWLSWRFAHPSRPATRSCGGP